MIDYASAVIVNRGRKAEKYVFQKIKGLVKRQVLPYIKRDGQTKKKY